MLDILENIHSMLEYKGTLIFEVQSLAHLIKGVVFDYIYHEHIFYHSLISLENLLNMAGLEIYDISLHPVKGGSYRIFASSKNSNSINPKVYLEKYQENIILNTDNSTWNKLKAYLMSIKEEIDRNMENKDLIVGYGAMQLVQFSKDISI